MHPGKCQRIFIARYHYTGPSAQYYSNPQCWQHLGSVPKVAVSKSFDAQIEQVPPSFVKIYSQAMTAESAGLDELSGTGLRKALEFLVKDYVKSLSVNAGKEKQIEATPLGACIKTYVTDGKVKAMASRATWLGNDETHYVRLWEGKDVGDLKMLIDLTVHGIVSEIVMRELEQSMPDPQKVKE